MNLKILSQFNIKPDETGSSTGCRFFNSGKEKISSYSPVDGSLIGTVIRSEKEDFDRVIQAAQTAFLKWRMIPAPNRGEIVRQIGEEIRKYKEPLGELVSYEMGKSLQEGYGEVQEMIDICDFAVGLSRQLYGLTMHSERPGHRMYEQWHPLGIVGIITAFNFPVAVWSWNAMIAMVCGNVCIWKPSEKTPITSLVLHKIIAGVLTRNDLPEGISNLIIGEKEIGGLMATDTRVSLLSATGSTHMGKSVAESVAKRLGKYLLELGGNNAIIISEHADLDVVIPGVVFGSVGTAGQRCTTTRRLIIHQKIYAVFKEKLVKAYQQIKIGNPLEPSNHMGPLIDHEAVSQYLKAIEQCKKEGGKLLVEGQALTGKGYESECYVTPCIAEVSPEYDIVKQETFAPILYIMPYATVDEAVQIQNGVPQGLSSAMMTLNMREAEYFLSHAGSDCGIANINIGTSGAEIGGAFGGEKETGGGRESGSDAWRNYMRRQTVTINYSDKLPLAQGINFSVD